MISPRILVLALAVAALSAAAERDGDRDQAAAASSRLPTARPIDWTADLDYLTSLLPHVHANAFHTVSRERFQAEADRLKTRIREMSGPVARVELARLVALIGDGHTRVNLLAPGGAGVPASPDSGFVPVPIRLYWFDDGFHVTSTSASHADLLGMKLTRIGGVDAEVAGARIGPYMHRDNDMTVRLGVPLLMVRPAFLQAAGIIAAPSSIPMEFRAAGGARVERVLRPDPDADAYAVRTALATGSGNYWFEATADSSSVYVQFNVVRDDDDEDMATFAARLDAFLTGRRFERVVLDLRNNDGGNFVLALPLIDVLDRFEERQGAGSLFVLIGRATFSAAGAVAALIDGRTDAVFIGEPTGARPNAYGDMDQFTLPSSGLAVAYSKRFVQSAGPYDERPWISPDITAVASYDDLAGGRDPAMRAVESYEHGKSLAARLLEQAREHSIESALQLYRSFMAAPERRYYHAAGDLTALGIDLWQRDRLQQSLAVWQELANDYPDSPEGLENIAETHAAMGNREAALTAMLRSLRTHPDNADAAEIIFELCGHATVLTLLRVERSRPEGQARIRQTCNDGA